MKSWQKWGISILLAFVAVALAVVYEISNSAFLESVVRIGYAVTVGVSLVLLVAFVIRVVLWGLD